MFDAKSFLYDHNIPARGYGPNSHPGWIQINCPFCGDNIYHGGFRLKHSRYNCWRCGHHDLPEVICELLKISPKQAYRILAQYRTPDDIEEEYRYEDPSISKPPISFPPGTGKLQDMHIKYLIKRNFDPEKLVREWNILGTSNYGDYRFRIIAPIYYNHRLVSYQGRDITDHQTARYKACPKEKELYHHKHLLYGIDNVKGGRVIVVEGITDVWRLGYGTVATFGTEWTIQQAVMLAKKFKQIFILYDKGGDAQERALRLQSTVKLLRKSTEVLLLETADDPGSLSDDNARYIKKQLSI